MLIKPFLLFLCVFFTLPLFAQLKPAPLDDGYRGGHIAGIKKLDGALNFIVFGDWGRMGEYFQKGVAREMGKAGYDLEPEFLVVTGDNFYPNGVASVQDYQWIGSFESIYSASSLQCPWYVVLGNHDYRGNVQAEIDYSKISRRWTMPERYYSKKVMIDEDPAQQVLLVFIDSSPFITGYYEESKYANVLQQDTVAQKRWLEKTLSDNDPQIKWKIVVGHHPLYTGGDRIDDPSTLDMRKSFKPLFDKFNVDLYLCGHEHSLQYVKPEGKTHYFISGAGSEATEAVKYPQIGKFAAAQGGFMAFSMTEKKAMVQVINHLGKVLYVSEIGK